MNCLQHATLRSSIFGASQQQKHSWVSSKAITGSVIGLSKLVFCEGKTRSPSSATGLRSGMPFLTCTMRLLLNLVKNCFHSFVTSLHRAFIWYASFTLYSVTNLNISRIFVHALGPQLKLSTCLKNSPLSNLHSSESNNKDYPWIFFCGRRSFLQPNMWLLVPLKVWANIWIT